MSIISVKKFLSEIQNNESFYNKLASAKTAEEREVIVSKAGFKFTEKEFLQVFNNLTDWEKTIIEESTSFRSDKRIAGLEMCCCCGVGGVHGKKAS